MVNRTARHEHPPDSGIMSLRTSPRVLDYQQPHVAEAIYTKEVFCSGYTHPYAIYYSCWPATILLESRFDQHGIPSGPESEDNSRECDTESN
jgi:hypothetical protein